MGDEGQVGIGIFGFVTDSTSKLDTRFLIAANAPAAVAETNTSSKPLMYALSGYAAFICSRANMLCAVCWFTSNPIGNRWLPA